MDRELFEATDNSLYEVLRLQGDLALIKESNKIAADVSCNSMNAIYSGMMPLNSTHHGCAYSCAIRVIQDIVDENAEEIARRTEEALEKRLAKVKEDMANILASADTTNQDKKL